MKKLLLGLFFVLCAFQVNAATFSLFDSTMTEVLGSPGSAVGNGQTVLKSDGMTGSYTWYVSVTPATESLVINGGSPSSGIFLTDVTIINTDTSLVVASDTGPTNEFTVTASLVASVLYSVTLGYEFIAGTATTVGTVDINVSQVPVPAAVWLFGSALMGLVGISRRKSGSMLSA